MKWSIQIGFEISRGRERIFSLRKLIPIFQHWHKQSKEYARSCWGKTRFSSEEAALRAEWFKRHPAPFRVYLCEICDGWHITTKV